MSESTYTILLVDPDPRARALLAQQLASEGTVVLQAEEGGSAFKIVNERDVRLVVTELYLRTGEDDDLIHAIRRTKALRRTRTLAHTIYGTAVDRDWAMRAGADGYLIKPTRPERLRYVVSRLASNGVPSSLPAASDTPVSRRDSLGLALADLEQGDMKGTSSIVFGRTWWQQLTPPQQSTYRKRAKRLGVSLRSDSMLGDHFVEVRGPSRSDQGLSTERPESPYRR
jgi:CheY-like chemotaxis protein